MDSFTRRGANSGSPTSSETTGAVLNDHIIMDPFAPAEETTKQDNSWLLPDDADGADHSATHQSIDIGCDHGQKPTVNVIHRRKTFLAIAILACAWIMNDLVLAWVHERVPYESDPLPDLWFSLFPEYQSAIKLTEALLIGSLLLALSIMIFHEQCWLVTRRVFFISALCYFGRAFCITLTQVPVPSRRTYCAPRANATSAGLVLRRVGGTMSGLGMDTLFAPRELCGDLIYSGHTTILWLCYLTVARYAPQSVQWLRHVSRLMSVIGVVGILIARKHYTLDVVLAYYITTRIYWIYHTLADNRATFFSPTNRSINKGTITNVFWAPIITYLESDTPSHKLPLGNQFGLPLRSCCGAVAVTVKRVAGRKFSLATFLFFRRPNKDTEEEKITKNSVCLAI